MVKISICASCLLLGAARLTHPLPADTLNQLREKEKAAGITPDPEIDAFMKASVQEGKASSAQTSFVLRLLGLEV